MTAIHQGLCALLTIFIYFEQVRSASETPNVTEAIKNDPDLSEFYNMLENSPAARNTIQFRSSTIFAPTNQAFQHFQTKQMNNKAKVTEALASYHISTQALDVNQLMRSISSDLEGNPPLWITRVNNDVYVNNARILTGKSKQQSPRDRRHKQVRQEWKLLHVIDQVMEPVLSTDPNFMLYNPNAFQFLNETEHLNVGEHRLRTFRQRVAQNQKEYIFKADGAYTFFIPVDEGFKPSLRAEKIDKRVIDGHVIPNRVLFTTPTPQGTEYETLANEHMMKVTIAFMSQKSGKSSKMYIKSNTVMGDQNHFKGVVLAEIVRANIPVKNGVVHLIDRPLMVVDTSVQQFIEEQKNGPLAKFYQVILDTGGDFMNRVVRGKYITLLAPSNAAWNESYMQNVMADHALMKEILDLHLIDSAVLTTNVIEQQNTKSLLQIQTTAPQKSIYFNVVRRYNGTTVTVEGGGVNATIIEADIAATNGVVHIIDRVLGVPHMTIAEKLDSDPMLNNTAFLGNRTHFNTRLGGHEGGRRFTYFVPRDYAWRTAEIQYPSAHKKLFMPQFSYHVSQILERHLVVHDKPYTMKELLMMSANDTVTLPSLRDSLKIKVKEHDKTIGAGVNDLLTPKKTFYFEWRGETVSVFRADVQCTNGIIHVIDKVLLKESDVRVNTATPSPASPALALFLSTLTLFLVKHFI